MRAETEERRFYLSKEALALLRKLDYPCSEPVLASAKRITGLEDEGIHYELSGDRRSLETLAGFVAGDANHAEPDEPKKKVALLYAISAALESVL